MSATVRERVLNRLAPALLPHLAELVERTVERITATIDSYRDESAMPPDELRSTIEGNLTYLLEHEPRAPRGETGPAASTCGSRPRETGRLHAQRGIPLPDVLSAYRIGFALLWDTITDVLQMHNALDTGEVIAAASEMWWRADHFGQEVTHGYRDATTELLVRQQHERSAMVEALVTGTIVEQPALWETASRLGIPYAGHFAVVVAAAQPIGTDPLPGIATALAALDVTSAWRLAPHQAVGVLSLPDPNLNPAVVRIAEQASGRVGVSPPFDHLEFAPRAHYLADIALRSRPRHNSLVRCFDDTPIAVLVAASPDAATAIARHVLGPVLDLPDNDRDTLLDTLETWLHSAGSINETAARQHCHPNTIRYRLRKLTDYTGRPFEDPVASSELHTALQAWRLLGNHMTEDSTHPRLTDARQSQSGAHQRRPPAGNRTDRR